MVAYDETTLLIKHFPIELKEEDRKDFLKHLGALEVKCIVSPVVKTSLTFAKFKTKDQTKAVLKELHQREVFGSLLSVEYAKGKQCGELDYGLKTSMKVDDISSQRKIVDAYQKKLSSWTDDLDFMLPPPFHIRYQYPAPTSEILRNICRAMANIPKLYTQVLHLMNRMNLPCPLSEKFNLESSFVEEDLEAFDDKSNIQVPVESSDDESEIESDGEKNISGADVPLVVKKRALPKKRVNFMPLKKMKTPQTDKTLLKPEEVFETKQVQVPKKIELKLSSDLTSLSDNQSQLEPSEEIGILEVPVVHEISEAQTPADDTNGNKPVGSISLEELEMNKILPKDFHLVSVFKNYQPGPPSCRLYLKNLAKTVQTEDLDHIFSRYQIEESGDQVNLYDIRLMQEGRMKGQAFVSLQSVELAEKALKETNGYILQGKAMVVQFARTSKPK